jgi:hypothetical protein
MTMARGHARRRRTRLAVALAALAACKSSRHESPAQTPPRPVDAAVVDANLDACRATAARVPSLPATQRAVALLKDCQPCGDWGPLLAWNTMVSDGGPSHAAIEQAMIACKAFCEPNAKQRFLGTLDGARGHPTRTPWRFLGEICKAEVSAVPDARFMGGPYFALDRIARALGGDPGLLAAIELPLPALSITGVGIDLPSSPVTAPDAGPVALTVDASHILLGSLPVAKLSATGLAVTGDYPGTPIDPKALAAALDKPALAGHPVALLAPEGLGATRIVEVIGAAGGHDVRLAVAAEGPPGWTLPGTVPISLIAKPAQAGAGIRLALDANADEAIKAAKAAPRADLVRGPVTIDVGSTATATSLASLLGALGYFEVKTVVLVTSASKPPAGKPPAAKPPAAKP